MSDPVPGPLEPTGQADSWRQLAEDMWSDWFADLNLPMTNGYVFEERLAALLAAEDEQPAAPVGRVRSDLANDVATVLSDCVGPGVGQQRATMDARERLRKWLAATPPDEHLPVFHIVEGRSWQPVPNGDVNSQIVQHKPHWHVRVVSRNGRTLLSSENYTEQRGALEAAHLVADPMGARV